MTPPALPSATVASQRFDKQIVRLSLVYLWLGLALDVTISILAWTDPQSWFQFFHRSYGQGREIALLHRAAGQWTAFALLQFVALVAFRRRPVWLAVAAGIRFSDVFTDLFYLLSAAPFTFWGKLTLAPLALVNAFGALLLLRCHQVLTTARQQASSS